MSYYIQQLTETISTYNYYLKKYFDVKEADGLLEEEKRILSCIDYGWHLEYDNLTIHFDSKKIMSIYYQYNKEEIKKRFGSFNYIKTYRVISTLKKENYLLVTTIDSSDNKVLIMLDETKKQIEEIKLS